jgi:hypothetical protein
MQGIGAIIGALAQVPAAGPDQLQTFQSQNDAFHFIQGRPARRWQRVAESGTVVQRMEDSVLRATKSERSSSARGTCISSVSRKKNSINQVLCLCARCITVQPQKPLACQFCKSPRLEEGQSPALFCLICCKRRGFASRSSCDHQTSRHQNPDSSKYPASGCFLLLVPESSTPRDPGAGVPLEAEIQN